MDFLTPVVAIVALFVVVKAIQVVIVLSRLATWRFRLPLSTLTEREALPPETAAVFQSAARQLAPLGFRYSHALRQQDPIAHIETPQSTQVFVHEETRTYAEVTPALSPEAGVLFTVSFVTLLTDGHAVVTVDCQLHGVLPRPQWCRFFDHYIGSIKRQWEQHQQSLQKTGAIYVLKPCSPEAFLEYNKKFLHEYITKNPILTPTSTPNLWRMQTVAAVPFAWGLVQGIAKSGRARKATRKSPGKAHREQPVVTKEHGAQSGQVASEVAAFERMQEVQNKAPGWSWLGKCALLLISVAVAGVSFGLTVSPSFVAVLLGVLFFHELGHWFGMWLFDYRDRQMFFIPFLGAAVTGNKEDATPMQQIIVALLGPVPGLILGAICLQWAPESGESLLRQIGWTALALNYLNLLPVNPLDGGRIVDLLLSRFPWIRFAFGLVSVLVLLFVGLTGASIMAGVAVAMMFTLAAQWRMNIALQRLRKLAGGTSATNRRERLSAIFQVLTQAPFHRQQAATRYELAKSLLRYLTTGPANWRTMFLGGTAYAAALLVPVYIGVKTAVATFHKEIATMDANCIPRTQPVMTTSLQDMLSKNEQQPTVVVHEVIAHIRAKVPCLADSQTYDLSDLTDDERLLWDLYWFDVKLSLGGFRTVFENDSANAAKLLTELERIGAVQSKALLERSLEAFPDKRMPETPEAIRAVLRQIDEDKSHPAHALWTQLHGEFVEQHMQEVDDHLHAYIRQHMASLSMPQALAQALPEKTAPALMVEKKPRRRE